MKVAVVGVTGLVGSVMLKSLEERDFPADELLAVASERSKGKEVVFRGKSHGVITPEEALSEKADFALFSAGSEFSLAWAPRFAAMGTRVIDNSSAWRMHPDVPLVVPEVNADLLSAKDRIIANPNCSTIQVVVVLDILQRLLGLRRVVVSTYQSVTGSGQKGVRQLSQERRGIYTEACYPHPIDLNIIPQGGNFLPGGDTTEEVKLLQESRKILGLPGLRLTATVVRVPVYGGHSASVNIEVERDFHLDDIRQALLQSPGLALVDEPGKQLYPMPIFAEGHDEIFVGRLRRDESLPHGLNLWIVADNLRKGAATNAVQIAQYLLAHHHE